MELTNESGLPAVLARTALDHETLMGASVSVRATYDYADGALTLAEAQPWTVALEPLETPYGELDGADPWGRAGVDVFVLGLAHAPDGAAVPSMELGVAVGAWRHAIRVIGDRAWVRVGEGLLATRPAPFAVMPLHIGRAYGGKSKWDGLDVPFGDNPEGRGFAIDEAQAEGAALPNLELLGREVASWRDQPEPAGVGFCPLHAGARVRAGAEFDTTTGQIMRVTPRLFQAAWPWMVAPSARVGEVVSAWGIDEAGPWSFALPDAPARLTLAFDDEVITPALEVSQIGFETEFHRVFITWRHAFKYHVYPRQKRVVALTPAAREAGA